MAEQITGLKTQRASTKGCITRIKNLVEQRAELLTATELECRLGILESYFKQALAYQTSIEQLAPEDNNEIKARSELEELYCATKSQLLSLMNGSRKASLPATDLGNKIVVGSTSTSNLPKLRLPQFSGKYTEFPNFIGCFTKLVHLDDSLSNLEKYNHLLSCLSGAALQTVKAFEITEDNYVKVLAQLKSRYDNKYLIFQEHIVELFNLPKVSKNDAGQLRSLIDSANAHLSALYSIGSAEDIANAFLIHIVNSKLDSDTQESWESVVDFSKLLSWQQCFDILSKRSQYLESRGVKVNFSESGSSHGQFSRHKIRYTKHTKSHATSLAAIQAYCAFCEEKGHVIYKCKKFLELPVTERFAATKQKLLCINCLFKGHPVRLCKVQRCRVCALPHHTLLHRYTPSPTIVDNVQLASTAKPFVEPTIKKVEHSNNTTLQTLRLDNEKDHVFLATAILKVKDKFGREYQARALLDSASQLNFVTERFAQFLQLARNKVETSISGIGDTHSQIRYSTDLSIGSMVTNYHTNLQVFILPNITGTQPERKITVDSWKIPQNIQLADPRFFKPQGVDLLIGTDLFFQLLCVGQIRLGEGLPILQKTLLGWIVAGKYSSRPTLENNYNCLICEEWESIPSNAEQSLFNLVERFWEEDSIESSSIPLTEEQEKCEIHFKETMQRDVQGRFVVKLPCRDHPKQILGESLEIATNRFRSLEKRLTKNPALKQMYAEFLKDYLESGHMESVSIEDVPHTHYFMPHQCVLRPDSSTTKLRVVFDASCKTSSHKSLNDALMVGPVVQEDIFSIILRFRSYKYALTADVQAMYRQIWVHPEDRNLQLILWRDSPKEDLQVFRLKTVTYGTASAPFLATRCLVQLAEDFVHQMPQASEIIKQSFYMDDLLTGADEYKDLLRIKNEIEIILSSAQFKLRKWYSNDKAFLGNIPEDSREKPLKFHDVDAVKTLGVVWEPTADNFRFHFKQALSHSSRITKRAVLSEVSRLFDPLGLINPIIVKAKIFLQELWILKLNWDESLPLLLEKSWKDFMLDLQGLKHLEIPRLVFSSNGSIRNEIHGFADASVRAYGCCLYIRSIDINGSISTNLLTAKSKVAPIKSRSLPCLELCAALLLSKLLDKTRQSIKKKINDIILWTDSEIVLDWLSSHPSTWKTYVANRVSEIQELTKNLTWRHVSSKANPADIVSRGSSVSELQTSIWFSGPAYLQEPSNLWPVNKIRRTNREEVPERRNWKTILVCSKSDNFLSTIYECSDFTKNCRLIALAIRFWKNLQLKKEKQNIVCPEITSTEIDNAFLRIVACIQKSEFAQEIRLLQDNRELKSHIKNLNPFWDESSGVALLRVGGRLRNSNLPYDTTFPILLPRNNPFVKSYINHLHVKNFHAGSLALVAILRQRFWVVNAREYTRKIVRSCLHCFKYRPRLVQQIMGDLPVSRVNQSLPFSHCGVDFCGPFQTTYRQRGKQTYKTYVAVFICFSTRAVHIEVVSDLTSDAFIAALKRFIGRRNLCKHIYCDNATNFVGARRLLREFREAFLKQQTQSEIIHWCSNNSIRFHHIPPRSPHFGGIWEAAIKSAKAHLYRTLQGSLLTFEELSTVMVQIEAVLNSRPITPLSSDPNDGQALTPSHFLVQAPLSCFVEPDLSKHKVNYLHRWQRLSALLQHFWKRWSKEYLSQLQQRFRWQSAHKDITVGMLVLVHQEDLPPFKWRLGRVVKTVKASDGHVRVADIRTSAGILQRAVHKLAPLPMDESD